MMAKVGLDGHDAGLMIVSKAFRDAGMEVIYLGIHQRPEQIALAALQEDVDVIGLSSLSGAHVSLVQQVMDRLKQKGLESTPVIVGGTVPERDVPLLRGMGVAEVFPTGSEIEPMVEFVKHLAS